jgi:hypothetical protein
VPPGSSTGTYDEARVVGLRALHQLGVDRLRRVVADAQRGLPVEQVGRAREQQLQVVVQLGHRADRAARAAHRVGLVDRDRRRHAVDAVDRRPVHAIEELARVRAERLDVAALPSAYSVSNTRLDLPDPLGPVTTVISPVRMSRSRFFRLC